MNINKPPEEILKDVQIFQKYSIKRESVNLPNLVYHYCSLESFYKIIESGELFLSHQSAMNDKSDSRLFFNILVKRANQIANELNAEILEKFLRLFYINMKDYFIASFSAESDLLNQWLTYGDKGKGVSIGFYTNSLDVSPKIPYFSQSNETGIGIFPLEYISDTNFEIADELLYLACEGWFTTPPNVENLILTKKHKSFENEKEIRIVEIQDMRLNLNPDFLMLRTNNIGKHYEYRIKNSDQFVPFRKLKFRYDNQKYHINNIWLGPENNCNEKHLTLFLEKNNTVLDAGICKSSSPYTNR
ncbi:DUF2971 domain-containing protein [Leptospira terpstrae]|uniref:PF11185 family protein n=1 Tax=Leptospira terpstrae serovar Hualin str. LT 11-33 = ATCC 700639 TaxID=1257025 RepID=N1W447_9LEPT|nr:DUF2971 domain-containing protein [Leptospira terpstrae]EMY62451.1 PF11185 family protein [Leptospira terpstrae serovar Hualin str. LT 11-33 = ATCC 700639]